MSDTKRRILTDDDGRPVRCEGIDGNQGCGLNATVSEDGFEFCADCHIGYLRGWGASEEQDLIRLERRDGPGRGRSTAPTETRSDRLSRAAERGFDPGSLVGSFFHRIDEDGKLTWQGCVVAEPAPGLLLLELFDWIIGASSCQRLVRIEDMTHWQFYDEIEWMRNEYEHGRWRRQAERDAGGWQRQVEREVEEEERRDRGRGAANAATNGDDPTHEATRTDDGAAIAAPD